MQTTEEKESAAAGLKTEEKGEGRQPAVTGSRGGLGFDGRKGREGDDRRLRQIEEEKGKRWAAARVNGEDERDGGRTGGRRKEKFLFSFLNLKT